MPESKLISVITGASKGIGKSIALNLAAEGHNLSLFGRNIERLEETKSECEAHGAETEIFAGDVSDENFVKLSIEKTLEIFGKIDNLINNAGIAHFELFDNSTLDQFKEQIDTNLYGVYNFCKSVLPSMKENQSGNIINISSLAGKNPFVRGTMYSASKHALMGFSKSLMLEVREFNIRVIILCPGSVATKMIHGSSMHPSNMEKILQPQDIADAVISVINMPSRANVSEIDIRPTNPK